MVSETTEKDLGCLHHHTVNREENKDGTEHLMAIERNKIA